MSVANIGKLQENTVALQNGAKLSATPSGFSKRICGALPYPDSLREKHMTLAIITPRTIAYPIRICCPDHWLKCTSLATSFESLPQPTAQALLRHSTPPHVSPPSDGVSGQMFSRFMVMVNELESLGKTYTEVEKVMKILRSLPKKWETKVTAIQEAKDLTKLSLEELIGSLMTYKINLNNHQELKKIKKV
ncbi:hypothetical protein AAG906_022975 [Vitis piasezkii]